MNKKKLKDDFIDLMNDWAIAFQKCQVKPNEIDRFAAVSNNIRYNDLRTTHKWMLQSLQPQILNFNHVWNQRKPEAWQRLEAIDRGHCDFKVLDDSKKAVRKVWRRRPRFDKDVQR